jgi:hypothetical protein
MENETPQASTPETQKKQVSDSDEAAPPPPESRSETSSDVNLVFEAIDEEDLHRLQEQLDRLNSVYGTGENHDSALRRRKGGVLLPLSTKHNYLFFISLPSIRSISLLVLNSL